MSTYQPPRKVAKTAAKRRAAARKRNREIGRQLFAYVVIAILVISTIATVLVVPLTQQAPANASVTATPDQGSQMAQLVTLGDQQLAAGNYFTATLYYEAYTQQNPADAAVQLKLAKAILQGPQPNYPEAQRALQQAASLPGSQQQEAQTLLTQVAPTLTAAAPSAVVTGTQTVTGAPPGVNPAGGIPGTPSPPANK